MHINININNLGEGQLRGRAALLGGHLVEPLGQGPHVCIYIYIYIYV